MSYNTICLDPGHGMGNRRTGVYDTGAVSAGVSEAEVVMKFVNVLRGVLQAKGKKVVRTRVDGKDPASIGIRAKVAKEFGCDIMLSMHCNAANGQANGTETFYRGEANAAFAKGLNDVVCKVLGTRNRGVKTENQSQHSRLAVMEFQPCFLIELGFIDHDGDRVKMQDENLMNQLAEEISKLLS